MILRVWISMDKLRNGKQAKSAETTNRFRMRVSKINNSWGILERERLKNLNYACVYRRDKFQEVSTLTKRKPKLTKLRESTLTTKKTSLTIDYENHTNPTTQLSARTYRRKTKPLQPIRRMLIEFLSTPPNNLIYVGGSVHFEYCTALQIFTLKSV
jgi:hypothetical protein